MKTGEPSYIPLLLALGLVVLLSITGCASMFTSETVASYELAPDGTVKANYRSGKNQEGFRARVALDRAGNVTGFDLQTTATTPEAAIAAAVQVQLLQMQLLEKLLPLIEKAAAAGAGS